MMNDSLKKFLTQFFLIALIIFSLANANNNPASSINGVNHASSDQSEVGSMLINSHSSNDEHRFLAEENADDDNDDEPIPHGSYKTQVAWPSTLTDKRQINQAEQARYSSLNTPENRPWAIPYRFGKRAAAMPYRFGKRRAAAMHFRLGKKSTAL